MCPGKSSTTFYRGFPAHHEARQVWIMTSFRPVGPYEVPGVEVRGSTKTDSGAIRDEIPYSEPYHD
jgi:hypothetical protein